VKTKIIEEKNKLRALNDQCKTQFGLFGIDLVNWSSRISLHGWKPQNEIDSRRI